ncbi:MAG: DUF2059 domain-containing protein [Lysobacter sp.]|nr:DUF2059 domain-containing protein [Lysobacter sp.]
MACFFAAPPAQAAQATEAQVDKLMDTMDMRRTLDDIFVQFDAMGESMGQQMLGEDATPEQRESLRRIITRQQASTRKAMSWDTLGPIYRKVYTKLFTAEEIEAMTAFYGSDTGRGIMRKMPQAVQLSMQEMQPLMQTMIADMRKTLETELQSADEDASKGAHKP